MKTRAESVNAVVEMWLALDDEYGHSTLQGIRQELIEELSGLGVTPEEIDTAIAKRRNETGLMQK